MDRGPGVDLRRILSGQFQLHVSVEDVLAGRASRVPRKRSQQLIEITPSVAHRPGILIGAVPTLQQHLRIAVRIGERSE
jgi:hypothetical protein